MNTEVLPYHPKFQDAIAASLWRSPALLNGYVTKFDANYFDDPTTASIMALVFEHYKNHGTTPSKPILFEQIRRMNPTNSEKHLEERRVMETKLVGLEDAADEIEGDYKYIGTQISKFISWRAVINEVRKVVDKAKTGEVDMDIVDNFSKAVRLGEVSTDFGVSLNNVPAILAKEVNPDARPRIPTGITHLDNEIGGGLRGGELGVFLAPPKGFKSGTLMNLAAAGLGVGVGKKVLYITLELSEELQILRFAIKTTGLEKDNLYKDLDDYIEKFQERRDVLYDEKADIHVKYFAPYVCTPRTIRNFLDTAKSELGIDFGLILIDYLDLMGSDVKKEKDYLEKVQICTDLRAIAVDYNLPIWTACRSTREAVGKKRINMGHMAGAFERVAIADLVLALCQTDAEKAQGIMRIAFVACRNDGGNKQIICDFQPAKMSISSIEAKELTDDDFEDDDNDKKFKGGGGKSRKKSEDSDFEDEARERGMQKLKKFSEQRKTGLTKQLLEEDDDHGLIA